MQINGCTVKFCKVSLQWKFICCLMAGSWFSRSIHKSEQTPRIPLFFLWIIGNFKHAGVVRSDQTLVEKEKKKKKETQGILYNDYYLTVWLNEAKSVQTAMEKFVVQRASCGLCGSVSTFASQERTKEVGSVSRLHSPQMSFIHCHGKNLSGKKFARFLIYFCEMEKYAEYHKPFQK